VERLRRVVAGARPHIYWQALQPGGNPPGSEQHACRSCDSKCERLLTRAEPTCAGQSQVARANASGQAGRQMVRLAFTALFLFLVFYSLRRVNLAAVRCQNHPCERVLLGPRLRQAFEGRPAGAPNQIRARLRMIGLRRKAGARAHPALLPCGSPLHLALRHARGFGYFRHHGQLS